MPAPPGGLTVGDETAAVDAGRLTSGGATLPGAGAPHQSGPGDGRTARSKNSRRSIDTGRTVLTPADPTAYTSGLARAPPSESSSSLGRSVAASRGPLALPAARLGLLRPDGALIAAGDLGDPRVDVFVGLVRSQDDGIEHCLVSILLTGVCD